MKAFLISVVGAALLLSPLTASAGGKKKNEEAAACPDKDKAKRNFVKGRLEHRRGNYEEAILLWLDSYDACQKPLTLLNIGNAYERLGDFKAALEYLEKFRPLADESEHADLDSRIKTLKIRVAEQEQAEAEQEAASSDADGADEEVEENGDTSPLGPAGWIVGATGIAALAGGTVTGILALSLDGDLAERCPEGNCPADSVEDIEQLDTLSTTTDVLLVVGGVLTAGGVLMLVLDQLDGTSTSVGLSVGPGLFGATLQRSF